MALSRHELPILEFDSDPRAVLAPDHEKLDIALPPKAVFAFLGDCIDEYAQAHQATQAGEFVSATKRFPIYVL